MKWLAKSTLCLLLALVGLALVTIAAADEAPRKIVVFKEHFANPGAQQDLIARHGGTSVRHLRLVNGMAVCLPEAAHAALARLPEVAFIEDDAEMSVEGRVTPLGKPAPAPAPQQLPWGVHRIDADLVWATSQATGVKIAIIDTGIDLTHPDLKANIKGGVNIINSLRSPNDDNGHGTHVAGTVAALNNTLGVVGVGPQISLYAVKVLAKNGRGYTSDVITGIEWCVNNGMQVANMSLGGPGTQALHGAVTAAYNAGLIMACAAGNNNGGSVDYPGAYPETIAVSATTQTDGFASFSSAGPEVDLAAPGSNIYSTYMGGGYAIGSGTSMATPHVTGTAALALAVKGPMGPEAMRAHLQATAEVLKKLSANQQGAGLVRADLATQ